MPFSEQSAMCSKNLVEEMETWESFDNNEETQRLHQTMEDLRAKGP
jgi:hypothetical protein